MTDNAGIPPRPNELVESKIKDLVQSFQEQIGGRIVGSLHVFLHRPVDDSTGVAIIMDYVPIEIKDESDNLIHIVHSVTDWANDQVMLKGDDDEDESEDGDTLPNG